MGWCAPAECCVVLERFALLFQKVDRVGELQNWVERHKFHIQKLEVILGLPVVCSLYDLVLPGAEVILTWYCLGLRG